MLNARSVSIADKYWARHLGCAPERFLAAAFEVVAHGEELADYHGVFALFRDANAVASVPPGQRDALQVLLRPLCQGGSPTDFASALAGVAAVVIGPAYIGYASEITGTASEARALESEDAAALRELQQACDATEWEHGGSPIEHPSSGVFVSGELVALAGYEVWGERLAHISVITHPGFRGLGFGHNVVAHIAQRAIGVGLLPQYRTLQANHASIRIAADLGFQSYATSVAVRLHPQA